MSSALRIHPGHGVGPFVLGMTRAELIELAGEPEQVERGEVADEGHEIWTFARGSVEVRFADLDGDRAVAIGVRDPEASLAGLKLIGCPARIALAMLHAAGIRPILLTDDFGEGMRDYEWPGGSLSFWVSRGLVEWVTVIPHYDDSGDVPLWPRDAHAGGAAR